MRGPACGGFTIPGFSIVLMRDLMASSLLIASSGSFFIAGCLNGLLLSYCLIFLMSCWFGGAVGTVEFPELMGVVGGNSCGFVYC